MSSKAVQAGKAKKTAVKAGNKTAAKKSTARVALTNSAAMKKAAAGAKAARAPKSSPARAIAPAELSHRIHALLHTIHQIERYEERLCSMQDAIKRSGKLNASLMRDLKDLLEEIPSVEYQHDLDAVRDAVPE